MNSLIEINFDGLVSPSHNFAGLAHGNLASEKNAGLVAHPREAALQGIAKMKVLADRGLLQAFLPPQLRPSLETLRRLGFVGTDDQVLQTALHEAPSIFAACCSASAMWAANAATVTPSTDAQDGRMHITPANLVSHFHRSIETAETARALRSIFANVSQFLHHEPLPATGWFSDEGAANHTRLTRGDGSGIHLFVFGKIESKEAARPAKFPARQSLEASQAIVRLHALPHDRVLFLQQSPEAIDAGVFHNDVISTGNENLFFCHEKAFLKQEEALSSIAALAGDGFHLLMVPESSISLERAVATYLFNSQMVTTSHGKMLLLSPLECKDDPAVSRYIERAIIGGANPIEEVIYQDLRQSMRNGGGPACLRLRVALTKEQIQALPTRIFFTPESEAFLRGWIEQYYPEELAWVDLANSRHYRQNRIAIEELWRWIGFDSPQIR